MVGKKLKEKGNIGNKLKELRTLKGIKVEDLAKTIEISKIKLKRIEKNKSQANIITLAKLAIYFNTKVDYLFDEYNKT